MRLFITLTRLRLGRHKRMSTESTIQSSLTPVLTVALVPFHSTSETILPLGGGVPAEFVEFLGFDGITFIVVFTVFNVLDQVLLFFFFEAKGVDEVLGDSQVGSLLLDTDVVDFTSGSLVEDGVKSTSDIFDKNEGASVLTTSVNTQRHSPLETANEFGNELFGVLVRTVDVVTTGNDEGELEGAEVRLGNELSGSLGGRVRVGGLKDHVFTVVLSFAFTVDFVSGDVDESLHAAAVGSFEEDVGTQDVDLGEGERVSEGVVDMRLSSKMHNSVNLLGLNNMTNKVTRTDVPLHELVVGVFLQIGNVLQARTIVQAIKVDNVVVGVVLHQPPDNMGTNKTGTTSNQDAFGGVDVVSHSERRGRRRGGKKKKKQALTMEGVGRFCQHVATPMSKNEIFTSKLKNSILHQYLYGVLRFLI